MTLRSAGPPDDVLDAYVARAGAQVDDAVVAATVDRAWQLLHERAGAPDPRTTAVRARWVAAATFGTALALTVGGAAAAGITYLHARSGTANSGWQVAAGGPGENLRKDAPDYPAELARLAADIPFAPGYERSRTAVLTTGSLAPEKSAVVSTGAARAEIAQAAICTWADAWLVAERAGDTASRARASTALAGSLTWRAVLAVDPAPDPRGERTDQGRAPTRFGWVLAVVAAARGDDAAGLVAAVAESGRCAPQTAPAIARDVTP